MSWFFFLLKIILYNIMRFILYVLIVWLIHSAEVQLKLDRKPPDLRKIEGKAEFDCMIIYNLLA